MIVDHILVMHNPSSAHRDSSRSGLVEIVAKRAALIRAGLFVILPLLSAAAENPMQEAPLDIGSHLELFVDSFLIESMNGVHLRLHEPRPAGTALVFDRPWEGVTSGYVTVFKDDDLYRMYYRGSSHPGYTIKSSLRPGEQEIPKHPEFTCYAESRDGITWIRPSLDLFEFNGSKGNNIVWTGPSAHDFSPFKDGNPGFFRKSCGFELMANGC
jgi:hypothetical protein